jgi:hypothetical protein
MDLYTWHSSVLVNEDRLCHVVKSATVEARTKEMERISSLCVQTKNQFSSLEFDTSLATFINGFLSDGEAIEECHMEFGLIRCTKKFKQYIWLGMVIYVYLIIRLK